MLDPKASSNYCMNGPIFHTDRNSFIQFEDRTAMPLVKARKLWDFVNWFFGWNDCHLCTCELTPVSQLYIIIIKSIFCPNHFLRIFTNGANFCLHIHSTNTGENIKYKIRSMNYRCIDRFLLWRQHKVLQDQIAGSKS